MELENLLEVKRGVGTNSLKPPLPMGLQMTPFSVDVLENMLVSQLTHTHTHTRGILNLDIVGSAIWV